MGLARLVGQIVLAVLSFAVVALQCAAAAGWVPQDSARDNLLVFVGALLVFIGTISGIIRGRRNSALARRSERLREAVISSLHTISEVTGVDIWVLGGSVFIPKRRLRRAWRQELRRALRFRLSNTPLPSDVTWVGVKGAIGRAWKTKRVIHQNWAEVATSIASDPASEDRVFEELPSNLRGEFTSDELRSIAGKYSEILAVPVWNRRNTKVLGVLSIDVPWSTDRSTGVALEMGGVDEVAATCAYTIADVIARR